MAIILHIDTSTTVCSVALSENSSCLIQRIDYQGQSHAKLLPLFLDEIINEAHARCLTVDAVAVSCGPGSYTGLRIGVSTAKGLSYGWNVPLIAIDTLSILCETFLKKNKVEAGALLCPMIDARRMEVYSAFYYHHLNQYRAILAEVIDEQSYKEILDLKKIYFFGSGAEKCKSVITHSNAFFTADIYPSAENMIRLSEIAFANQNFKDVAYFEPFYLKEFITTVPKKEI